MIRKGLDFFPLNTVLDDKFQLIEAEYGLKPEKLRLEAEMGSPRRKNEIGKS